MSKIGAFPISLIQIARSSGNIKIIKNSKVNQLAAYERGACLHHGPQWFVIYDDSESLVNCRHTVAHEFGHIFLDHESQRRTMTCRDKRQIEREAEFFAVCLLAPACVLYEIGVFEPREIATLCKIPRSVAQKISITTPGEPIEYQVINQLKK